jgi:catechol 2,3-dioxygenase-like lactoylglutathione lyase family enzyme
MEQRISLITLGVTDLQASHAFYEVLGWKPGFTNDEVVFFQLGGLVLALWSREELAKDANLPTPGTPGAIALAYNVRDRAEVDRALANAEKAGARILKAGTETPWGGYSGYFADPDGHPWEVAHNPAWTLAPDGSVRM